MIFLLNGTNISGSQFTINGINYPSNWCNLSNNIDLQNLGIITLAEIYPSLGINQYYDGTYIDNLDSLQRIYNYVDMTPDMVNAPILHQISILQQQQYQLGINVTLGLPNAVSILQDSQTQINALQNQLISSSP